MKPLSPAAKALVTVPFEKLPSTKAWKVTSELVRKSLDGRCYTCGKVYPFNKLVAGHFIEKRGNANTYFDLDNLRPQCQWYCNRQRHGAKDVYAEKLIEEKGSHIIKELFRRAGKTKKWTKGELEQIAEERGKCLIAHDYKVFWQTVGDEPIAIHHVTCARCGMEEPIEETRQKSKERWEKVEALEQSIQKQ